MTDEAFELAPHKKDVQYFALALKFDCPIWSDEVKFKKQSSVNVYNTSEVLELLFTGHIG